MKAIDAGIGESIRSGTTLLGDVTYGGWSGEALQATPLRSTAFLELVGLADGRWVASLVQAASWFHRLKDTPVSKLGWSPHSPYSVARGLLRACLREATTCPCPIAIHFAETRDELELLSSLSGPLRQFLQDVGAWEPGDLHASLLEIALELGKHDQVLYVHANYLFEMPDHDAVLDQLAKGTASVVYCPRTHAYFGHPPHPFLRLLQRGYNVALGTDSLASNPDLSVLNEMRFLWRRQRQELSGADLLRMGTLNGARALGWGGQVGSLTPGKHADFITIELASTGDEPHEALFAGGDVTGVWIGGTQQQI
jgi:cytosine/adenosine deaminase-related metal-dependent hydrolase